MKALFGKRLKEAASRYGSRSIRSYGKGSYGTNSTASEAGHTGQSRRQPYNEPATELKEATRKPKVDSAHSRTPDRPRHIVHSMRSHEHSEDYGEEVPVAYSGSAALPRAQTISPIHAESLSNTPFPPPPSRATSNNRASFLMPPSPTGSSNDEVRLVSDLRAGALSAQSDRESLKPDRMYSMRSPEDVRRMSARSISPSALSDEGVHPDPLMPMSQAGPKVQLNGDRNRLERTKFPVI